MKSHSRRGLKRIVELEEIVAHGGMGQIWRAKNLNPFALLAELVINGELAPEWVGLQDVPFEEPDGAHLPVPITDYAVIQRIYVGADQLQAEHAALRSENPVKADQQYRDLLTAINPRLLKNPNIAVKVLAPVISADKGEDYQQRLMQEFGRRFLQENHMLCRLDHPGVVGRFGLVNDPEKGLCMLLEYIEGENLDEVLRKQEDKRLPLDAAASVGLQVAEALRHIHSKGVIHRDIKPSNIMLTPDGRAVLADFGIGKWSEGDMTMTGTLLGTPDYMAPEQVEGKATAATDVYQLGAVLYRLVTGRVPYAGLSHQVVYSMLARVDLEHPGYVFQLRPEISNDFECLIEKARDKNSAERWTVEELIRGLRELRVFEEPPRVASVPDLKRRMKAIAWERKRIETQIHFVDIVDRIAEAEGLIGEKKFSGASLLIEALLEEVQPQGARYDDIRQRILGLQRDAQEAVSSNEAVTLLAKARRHAAAQDYPACGAALKMLAHQLASLPEESHRDLHAGCRKLAEEFKPREPFVEVFLSVQKSFLDKVFTGVQDLYAIHAAGGAVEPARIDALLQETLAAAGMLNTLDAANVGIAYEKAVRDLSDRCVALKDLGAMFAPPDSESMRSIKSSVERCERAIVSLFRRLGAASI